MGNEVIRLPDVAVPMEEFTPGERFFLLAGVLPQQGNFTTLKIVHQLRMELSFSEEEHVKYEIKVSPKGSISYRIDEKLINDKKSVPLGKRAREVIVDGLKRLDAAGKMEMGHVLLYERFVVGGEGNGAETP